VPPALDASIDKTRLFVCPTLTPLFYTSIYAELSPVQKLRANQISALYFNELISFFETAFAPKVLEGLARARSGGAPELAGALRGFHEEECRHSEMFRELNRRSAPEWYAAGDMHVLVVPRVARALLEALARHPVAFPFLLWIMLAMEEHSIEVSRRCAQVPKEQIEPHWAAVYRAHLEDEVRHVQLDWHLLDRFYAERPAPVRRMNAWLLRVVMGRFFVRPERTSPRIVALLVAELPELRGLVPRLERELRSLGSHPGYLTMMYSRSVTPLTFALFDRFPELWPMQRVLFTYTPAPAGPA
jgi:hypothetical protein